MVVEFTKRIVMKTVILAGGLGSRMREETEFKPKPMVEIGGNPILWHIMKLYNHFDYREFVICMGYKQEKIIEYFIDYSTMDQNININIENNNTLSFENKITGLEDVRVTLVNTGLETNTAGRILQIKDQISSGDSFMLTYGDGLSNVNIKELVGFHNSHSGIATFSAIKTRSRFAVVETDENNCVTMFDEKAELENRINGGFMVCDWKVFDYISNNEESFEKTTLKNIAGEKKLYAYNHNGYFQPMDTYREAKELNQLWSEGKAPWKVWNE